MASASVSTDGDFLDYTKEELDDILQEVERYEREELNESDVDVGEEEAGEEGEESDEDDDVPLSAFVTTWRPATSAPVVRPFEEETGPDHDLPDTATPLEYFFLFLPQLFFTIVADQTNLYARQQMAKRGQPDPLWQDTTPAEMRAYVAVLIMMGIKRLPRLWCYWSTDLRFSEPWISGVMSKTRFLKLNQYFHLRDTQNTPGRDSPDYDPLYKIRPFLDLILPLFKKNFKPGRDLSVDEAMIGFKGRVFFKQYMPAKPTKWGVKVWEMCDADTGYCINFDIYTGKHSRTNTNVPLGHEVVDKMASEYYGQNRHLYFDRFFTSVPLMQHLSQHGTYACATVMSNRKGLPEEVTKARLKQQGELIQMQKGPLMMTAYKDKRPIYFLSTNQPPGKTTPAPGSDDKPQPHVIKAYNHNMGGVDKSDQHRAYYPVGHQNKKWWRYLFHSLVNLIIVQAYITWQRSPHNPTPKKTYDHLWFRADVAEQLRAGFTSRKKNAGRRSNTAEAPIAKETIDHHKQVKIEGRKRTCRQCVNVGRKTAKGRQPETSFKCSFCDVPLCQHNDCFRDYHAANMVETMDQE